MARGINKEKRDEKIRHILATAKEVFAEKGYEGARTDEIADRAGISKMSMYYYVGDKQTLYEAVIQDLIDTAEKHIIMETFADESPRDNIKKIVRGMAEVADKEPHLHAVLLRELISGGTYLPDEHPKGIRKNVKMIKNVIDKGRDMAAFDDTDPLIVFFLLMSFFVYWKIHLPVMNKIDLRHHYSKKNDKNISEEVIEQIEMVMTKILTRTQ